MIVQFVEGVWRLLDLLRQQRGHDSDVDIWPLEPAALDRRAAVRFNVCAQLLKRGLGKLVPRPPGPALGIARLTRRERMSYHAVLLLLLQQLAPEVVRLAIPRGSTRVRF